MSVVLVAKLSKTLKRMYKSCIVKKQIKPLTKAHDAKEFEICEDKFEIEKDIIDNFTQRHGNSIDPSIVKCAYDKYSEDEDGDSCLDECIPQ